MKEIEKKYLVKYMPNITNCYKKRIEQFYINVDDPIIRLRKNNDIYYLTYKKRIESEKK